MLFNARKTWGRNWGVCKAPRPLATMKAFCTRFCTFVCAIDNFRRLVPVHGVNCPYSRAPYRADLMRATGGPKRCTTPSVGPSDLASGLPAARRFYLTNLPGLQSCKHGDARIPHPRLSLPSLKVVDCKKSTPVPLATIPLAATASSCNACSRSSVCATGHINSPGLLGNCLQRRSRQPRLCEKIRLTQIATKLPARHLHPIPTNESADRQSQLGSSMQARHIFNALATQLNIRFRQTKRPRFVAGYLSDKPALEPTGVSCINILRSVPCQHSSWGHIEADRY